MIDYHLHLVPHDTRRRFSVDDVRAYARRAAQRGLTEIAITEHFYRFPDVQDRLGPWWDAYPEPHLRAQVREYFAAERLPQTLSEYVDVVLEAAADPGPDAVPVRLGLEVDLIPGRADIVSDGLASHPFDVLLGAVHWIGAFGFDQVGDPVVAQEWARRDGNAVWLDYVGEIEVMAQSGACDVLAHVDLPKLTGVRPSGAAAEECTERLVKAAAANELDVEINTNGWRKPVEEAYPGPGLLSAFRHAGAGITLATDAHGTERVGDRIDDAVGLAVAAGYTECHRYRARTAVPAPLLRDG